MTEFNPESGMEDKTQRDLEQARAREQLSVAEILRQRDYRSDITVIGSDLIKEIQEAAEKGDYERLREAVYEALPLAEGLEFGIFAKSYGIPEERPDLSRLSEDEKEVAQTKENNVYSKLRNLFLTVEDSVDRGNVGYLRDAVLDTLSRPLRELEKWEVDEGTAWEERQRKVIEDGFDRENLSKVLSGEEPFTQEEIKSRVDQSIELLRKKQQEKMDGIRENRDELLMLDHHVKSRFVFDNAFRQRQYVSWNRDLQSNMKESVGLGAAEPDGTHWQGFYQVDREWGEAVDKVERELVDMAKNGVTVPGSPEPTKGIFTGNPNSKQFKVIMDRMLGTSRIDGKRRMDVVWAAWRQFCLKEIAGKFDMLEAKIDDEDVSKGHSLNFGANPPYVSDLATWLNHPEEHRAAEFGWNRETLDANRKGGWDGRLVGSRAKRYKSVSHSGHPMSIGHLTQLDDSPEFPIAKFGRWKVGNFMEFATMSDKKEEVADERFRGKNLWQIWQGQEEKRDEKGEIIQEKQDPLSQAHPQFPWVDTDFAAVKGTADEAPSGLVGYWFLQRGRAYSILKENLGVSEANKVGSISYTATLRNWDKLGMVKPGGLVDGIPKNPYVWKALSDLAFYTHTTRLGELSLSATSYRERVDKEAAGHRSEGLNANDYLDNCITFGLISEEEKNWIKKRLTL